MKFHTMSLWVVSILFATLLITGLTGKGLNPINGAIFWVGFGLYLIAYFLEDISQT